MSGRRIYDIDDSCFDDVDTEIKAYLLGFIYADGSVSANGYYLSLDILRSDEYIIDVLLDLIYTTGHRPDKYYHSNPGTGTEYVRVTISSKRIVQRLINYGVVPGKIKTIEFPHWIRNDLVRHFIRGYFDGNGSITDSNRRPYFSIVSNRIFVSDVLNILHAECDTGMLSICRSGKTPGVDKFTVTRYNDIRKIYDYLYYESNICLERKRGKFTAIIENIRECPAFNREVSSKHKGVSFDNNRKKWIVYVGRKYVGRYDTEEEAYKMRLKYEEKTSVGTESGCGRSN